jgi:hypothetical protein
MIVAMAVFRPPILLDFRGLMKNCSKSLDQTKYFLTSCNRNSLGHQAYFLNLEPGLMETVKTADVLFIGNSRLASAFRAPVLREFFNSKNSSFFVLNFPGTTSNFIFEIFKKYKLKPSLVVINNDYIFKEVRNGREASLINDEVITRSLYVVEYYLINILIDLRKNHYFQKWLDIGAKNLKPNYFESRDNGMERIVNEPMAQKKIIQTKTETNLDNLPSAQRNIIKSSIVRGMPFIRWLRQNNVQVIFTQVPYGGAEPSINYHMSKKLGITSIVPQVEELYTYDNSHLNYESAQRWLNAFIKDFHKIQY